MMRRFLLLLLIADLLAGCAPPSGDSAEPDSGLQLSAVLGGDDTSGFLRATAPRTFSFPGDHGLHPGFRNEWWYFTGNLETAEGRRFGYQLTFFTAAVPPRAEVPPVSEWHSERLWMAHLALTDVEAGVHHAVERFSRENPGLAGAQAEPLRVWLEDWQLTQTDAGGTWRLQAADGELALDLLLVAQKAPVLQGENGLSRKSPEPGNASYYYSLTRLQTRGTVRSGGGEFAVAGSSWLDREWSTSALAADQSGWDWFSLQFDDGRELMYYQLRDAAGQAHPNSLGNWTDAAATQSLITPSSITLTELDHWTSPSGIRYTTAWNLALDGNAWQIRAVLPDQWMNLTIPYWEGAVDIVDPTGTRVGRGYLEMVR